VKRRISLHQKKNEEEERFFGPKTGPQNDRGIFQEPAREHDINWGRAKARPYKACRSNLLSAAKSFPLGHNGFGGGGCVDRSRDFAHTIYGLRCGGAAAERGKWAN